MLRLFVTTIFTTLLGLGLGYFMWGSRVVRLTESLNNMTLEYDALRSELATRPPRTDGSGGAPAVGDEIRVINEGVAALRQEQAAQRVILDQLSSTGAGTGASAIAAACEDKTAALRTEIDRCNADKQDLQARVSGAARETERYTPPAPAPSPAPPPPLPGRRDPRYDNRY